MLDNWHRIERIVKWTGLSVNAFAHTIGLNRAENLYQIKKGNNGISRELADTIAAKYPNISRAWILTGEGEMLGSEQKSSLSDIPIFEVEITKLMAAEQKPAPDYYMSLPWFKGSDFTAVSLTDSMVPDIPAFARVVFKAVELEDIVPGNMYFVGSKTYSGIRYVRREIGSSTLRLVPSNTDKYDELAVEVDQVEKLLQVKGIIIDKSI